MHRSRWIIAGVALALVALGLTLPARAQQDSYEYYWVLTNAQPSYTYKPTPGYICQVIATGSESYDPDLAAAYWTATNNVVLAPRIPLPSSWGAEPVWIDSMANTNTGDTFEFTKAPETDALLEFRCEDRDPWHENPTAEPTTPPFPTPITGTHPECQSVPLLPYESYTFLDGIPYRAWSHAGYVTARYADRYSAPTRLPFYSDTTPGFEVEAEQPYVFTADYMPYEFVGPDVLVLCPEGVTVPTPVASPTPTPTLGPEGESCDNPISVWTDTYTTTFSAVGGGTAQRSLGRVPIPADYSFLEFSCTGGWREAWLNVGGSDVMMNCGANQTKWHRYSTTDAHPLSMLAQERAYGTISIRFGKPVVIPIDASPPVVPPDDTWYPVWEGCVEGWQGTNDDLVDGTYVGSGIRFELNDPGNLPDAWRAANSNQYDLVGLVDDVNGVPDWCEGRTCPLAAPPWPNNEFSVPSNAVGFAVVQSDFFRAVGPRTVELRIEMMREIINGNTPTPTASPTHTHTPTAGPSPTNTATGTPSEPTDTPTATVATNCRIQPLSAQGTTKLSFTRGYAIYQHSAGAIGYERDTDTGTETGTLDTYGGTAITVLAGDDVTFEPIAYTTSPEILLCTITTTATTTGTPAATAQPPANCEDIALPAESGIITNIAMTSRTTIQDVTQPITSGVKLWAAWRAPDGALWRVPTSETTWKDMWGRTETPPAPSGDQVFVARGDWDGSEGYEAIIRVCRYPNEPTGTPTSTNTPLPTGTARATRTSVVLPTTDILTDTAVCVMPRTPTVNATLGTMPDLGVELPTFEAVQWVTATVQIEVGTVAAVISDTGGLLRTPVAELQTATANYTYEDGQARADAWAAWLTPAFGWLSVVNPANAAYSLEGSPLWALAPVLIPLSPIIAISVVVVFMRFTWFLLDIIRKLLEFMMSLIELIPGE